MLDQVGTLYSAYWNRFSYSLLLTKRVLILFSISALITALVNLGALGTVFVVRRQIKLGYSQFAGLRTVASVRVPDEGAVAAGDREPDEMVQVDLSVTPATPPLFAADTALGPAPPLGALGPSGRSSLVRLPSSASHSSRASRLPSRARVRALAVDKDAGLGHERAKNLQRLQRAEADLITTGVAMGLLSVSVAVLAIWTAVLVMNFESFTWTAYEVALLGGTWIYSFIQAVSIT